MEPIHGGFGLFNDSSSLVYLGHNISLNVMATACKDSNEPWVSIKIGAHHTAGAAAVV